MKNFQYSERTVVQRYWQVGVVLISKWEGPHNMACRVVTLLTGLCRFEATEVGNGGRWDTETGLWGLWGVACSSGLQLTSTQPFLALCHAPSSPPELSVTCQNQSENLMVSASHVQVWTGWHQISGATRQPPYENRCPHYWVATALKDNILLLVNSKSYWVTVGDSYFALALY